jgi:hypothetical protein
LNPKKLLFPTTWMSGAKVTLFPLTRNEPTGSSPVAVLIWIEAKLTELGSTGLLNWKVIGWFWAMSLIEQPTELQPRLQATTQNACAPPPTPVPSSQEGDVADAVPPPLEQLDKTESAAARAGRKRDRTCIVSLGDGVLVIHAVELASSGSSAGGGTCDADGTFDATR